MTVPGEALPAPNEPQHQRSTWADAIRGLAIILVVVGHVVQFGAHDKLDVFVQPLFVGIYSFHMPLFALVSGYLALASVRKYSFRRLTALRTRGLLLPFAAWTIVGGGTLAILRQLAKGTLHPERVAEAVGGSFVTPESSLWFLWAMFCCYVLASLAMKAPGPLWIPAGVLLGAALMLVPLDSVLAFTQIKWLYPFFLAGMVAAAAKSVLRRWELIGSLGASVLFATLLAAWQREDSVYVSRMDVDGMSLLDVASTYGYRYAVALSGAVAAIGIVRILGRHFQLKALRSLGTASLGIYAVQTYPVTALSVLPTPAGDGALYFGFYVPIVSALIVAFSYLMVVYVLRRYRPLRTVFLGGR